MTDKIAGPDGSELSEGLGPTRDAVLRELDDRTNQTWAGKRERWAAFVRAQDAEIEQLRAAAAKSERRAIESGDIVHKQVLTMRAAVVAAKLEGLDVGMQWIANTLFGPGHLPDLEEAQALGGAQALWDKETAEHEAFRAAHPGPVAVGPNVGAKLETTAAPK